MHSPTDTELNVEVVYALPEQQRVVRVSLPTGACVIDAIRASRLLSEFPEIDLAVNVVGVWGRVAGLEQSLRARDRVEIYRPLAVDPKQARVYRAQSVTQQTGPKKKRC